MKRWTLLLLCSCLAFWGCPIDKFWYKLFINNTSKDLYIILDYNPLDDWISPNISQCRYVKANSTIKLEWDEPWEQVVKDSMYIYIFDSSHPPIQVNYYLSTDDVALIDKDYLITRMTLLQHDTSPTISFYGRP